MLANSWFEKRKQQWQRLELLLEQTKLAGLRGCTRAELRELGLLYRQAAADLSILREDPGSRHFARYLNQLLGRVHNIIYSGHRSRAREVWNFFWNDYPRVFRRALGYTATATLLFAIGAVTGTLLAIAQPEFMHRFLGPEMTETIERHKMWTHSIVAIKPFASSEIMTNNISVAFATFAFGLTGGLGTIYMMFFNGLLMGVISAACWLSGMSLSLWSFVAPHGVLELPAIFIAGGAGLQLGAGLLFPGNLSRAEAIRVAGGRAVRLLVGVIPILIVAGIIEAFVSPSELPVSLKFLCAAAGFVVLLFYLFAHAAGRDVTEDSSL